MIRKDWLLRLPDVDDLVPVVEDIDLQGLMLDGLLDGVELAFPMGPAHLHRVPKFRRLLVHVGLSIGVQI